MFEARLENDEMEDGSLYKTIDAVLKDEDRCSGNELNNENVENGTGTQDDSASNNIVNNYKFKLVHKRWEPLYDSNGAAKLQNAMKRHLYNSKSSMERRLSTLQNHKRSSLNPFGFQFFYHNILYGTVANRGIL